MFPGTSTTTLGRALGNDIHLPDASVAHHHAQIVFNGRDFQLEELDREGEILINGKKKRRARLANGDRFTLFQILLAVVASTVIVLILIGITYYRLPWRKLPDPGPPQAEPAPRIVEPAIPAPQPAKPGAYAESP